MDNNTSEIEKLTERIEKDPKSKLFVPLAEEYKKAGDIEMSIHILTEGLKHNPGYITAKSFLGRLLLEKGDLAGAQKEFEEVVKAIPDNLLAHRKLGDIYAIQGDAGKAQSHYKTVLSLNAGDEEVSSLIADLAAGRPVKERVSAHLKPAPAPGKPAAQKPAGPVSPRPAVALAGQAGGAPSAGTAVEIPEEVLVVEPLEPEAPVPGGVAAGFEFLVETAPHPVPAEEPARAGLFELGMQQPSVESPAPGEAGPATAPFGTSAPTVPEEQLKKADDFTTNTLAELYIAQGFYDKALEIYERMLGDNPGNQAIQNKLQSIRAMAGSTAPSPAREGASRPVTQVATPFSQGDEPPATVFSGSGAVSAFGSSIDSADQTSSPGSGNGVSLEPAAPSAESVPPPLETAWEPPSREFVPPVAEAGGQAVPFDTGFAPTEYKPPQAIRDREPERPVAMGARPAAAGRKETIDRLEQWLKNIMKEKRS